MTLMTAVCECSLPQIQAGGFKQPIVGEDHDWCTLQDRPRNQWALWPIMPWYYLIILVKAYCTCNTCSKQLSQSPTSARNDKGLRPPTLGDLKGWAAAMNTQSCMAKDEWGFSVPRKNLGSKVRSLRSDKQSRVEL